MYRHIFMIPIKNGITDEFLQKKIQEMKDMKLAAPEIEEIHVGRTCGWIGSADNVLMTIDVKDKEAFDRIIASAAHRKVADTAEEAFIPEKAVIAQIEL